jgi:uncharacterized cupredoxin-like copper-binding protein
MKKLFPLLAMVIVLSLVLTACSGGGPTTDLKVDMTDFTFTPNHFTVPAGQAITLTATNSGAVVHEFVIMKLGTTVGADFGEEDQPNIYWEIQVQPGSNMTTTFTAPAPGEYQVVCGVSGHFMAGMVASLTVVAP